VLLIFLASADRCHPPVELANQSTLAFTAKPTINHHKQPVKSISPLPNRHSKIANLHACGALKLEALLLPKAAMRKHPKLRRPEGTQ
jgi:hypothetical protein